MKLSARNVIEGTVKQVVPGAVNTEVVIEPPGGTEIVSNITSASATSRLSRWKRSRGSSVPSA